MSDCKVTVGGVNSYCRGHVWSKNLQEVFCCPNFAASTRGYESSSAPKPVINPFTTS